MIGRTLSTYRVVEKLGEGGMGEVYLARDERLGREVALKILPAGGPSDETARSRFRKEAQALLRLSHPHVATLLDFGTADGLDFLVMERVSGPTLDLVLRNGPLPEKDVVRLGAQLARGLQAAHEAGVVHRDLKPSNLALTADGLLKVLDFGLARLQGPGDGERAEDTPTETAPGLVVGSPPYMSPEQLMGKEADARSDVYSAGACLYELVTGRRPYGERSGPSLVEAILHEHPEAPSRLRTGVSPGLDPVIAKAMDKDAGLRYQTARELLVDLERLQQGSASRAGQRFGDRTLSPARRRWWPAWLAATGAVIGLGVWSLLPPAPPRVTNLRSIVAGLDYTIDNQFGLASWATDGQRVYYLAARSGRVSLSQVPITGGESAEIPLPFNRALMVLGFVPYHSALLMAGRHEGDPDPKDGLPVWIVPVPAGAPRRLGQIEAQWAAASPDGSTIAVLQKDRIAFLRWDGRIEREIPVQGLYPGPVAWAADGRRLRYNALVEGERCAFEVPVEGGTSRSVACDVGGLLAGTPDERYLVFERWSREESRTDLFALRRPRLPLLPSSPPTRLTLGPLHFTQVGATPDGKHLIAWGDAPRGELLKWEPSRRRFEPWLGGLSAGYVDTSPDGDWIAYVTYPELALWKSRIDGTERIRLTGPGWMVHLPRWSPDGRRLAFAGMRVDGRFNSFRIFQMAASGGEPELLASGDEEKGEALWDPCWLPGGDALVYSRLMERGILRLDLQTRRITTLPDSERFRFPKCSPRGDVLAWEGTNMSSKPPVYWVRRAGSEQWERVGQRPLVYPTWTRDGAAFVGFNPDAKRVERWSWSTKRFEPVADVGDTTLVIWFQVPWMGLAPDGSPLVVRDRSASDLYVLDWEAP